ASHAPSLPADHLRRPHAVRERPDHQGSDARAEGRRRQGHHRLPRARARQEAGAHACRDPGDRRSGLGLRRDADRRLEATATGLVTARAGKIAVPRHDAAMLSIETRDPPSRPRRRPMTRMLTVLSALLLAMPLAAQATALHGTWRGTGEDNEEEKLELRANGTAISGEDTMKWRFVRDGLIRFVADGESLDVPYELSGDRLVLVLLGDRYPYERVGARPPAPAGGATPPPNPLGGKAGGSAVAKPKADPFARRFAGENIALSLSRSTDGYTGELTFQGETYPVRATAEGHAL